MGCSGVRPLGALKRSIRSCSGTGFRIPDRNTFDGFDGLEGFDGTAFTFDPWKKITPAMTEYLITAFPLDFAENDSCRCNSRLRGLGAGRIWSRDRIGHAKEDSAINDVGRVFSKRASIRWALVGLSLGVRWAFLGLSLGLRCAFVGLSLGFRWASVGLSLGFRWTFGGLSLGFRR